MGSRPTSGLQGPAWLGSGRVGGILFSVPLPSEPAAVRYRAQYTQRKQQKSRRPRPSSQYNQKLFGGDMEKFIQVLAPPHALAK